MKMEHPYRQSLNQFYESLIRRRPDFEKRYSELTPTSHKLFKQASEVLPGGSTRDSVVRGPYPAFVARGEGAYMFDVDGRKLHDFWFNASSLPLGHCNPVVVKAVQGRMALGSAFFAPTEDATELASAILGRLKGAEKVRFTNSGTEAVMMAVRIARSATGRHMIAKFEGSYHGSYDDVSWSVNPGAGAVGSAAEPNAVAESSGLPPAIGRTLVLPYNDLQATESLIEKHAGQVAALLVEPVANRMGLILPSKDFIQGLRKLCDRFGIVLIFDEVIAFRIGFNGAQGVLGVQPDLTTLGKVIGGGFPVGAVLGRDKLMSVSEPNRRDGVKHTGTFNANPVTMVAGMETLRQLTPSTFDQINSLGEYVRTKLRSAVEGLPVQIDGEGSLFKISASATKITDFRTSLYANVDWEAAMSLALMNEGFFLPPRLHGCVSTVTSMEDANAFISAFEKILMI